MRQEREGLHSTRKTIRPWYSESDESETAELRRAFSTLYPHMFVEDLSLGVMPVGARAMRKDFAVELLPLDKSVERIVIDALDRRYHDDLAENVSEFFREVSQVLLTFGEAAYEIVYFSEKVGGKPKSFHLDLISPGTLGRRWNNYVQIVPRQDVTKRTLPRRIPIAADDALIFPFPGNVRRLKQGLLILGNISEHPGPRFLMEAKPGALAAVPYDFSQHHRQTNITIATVTSPTGWTARGLLEKDLLEYYSILRFLRCEEFKISLRETILAGLNSCIARAGRRIGFTASVEVKGLPTLAEVTHARKTLISGPSSFQEIIKPFLRA